MAKFGWFSGSSDVPTQEFEGDSLVLNPQGQSVAVMVPDGAGGAKALAVIRLAEDECVKVIK
jgi:hypothetical protein